jgi:hypothetical protein
MLFLIMALVVFIRGVNVGGHRTLRPSVLARGLSDYGVVNVGAAGTTRLVLSRLPPTLTAPQRNQETHSD